MDLMIQVHHLSASAISAFEECPMAFYGRYHYRWEWVSPPMMAQAMELGKAVDHAAGALHQGRDPMWALCQYWGSITIPMPSIAFTKAVAMVRCYATDMKRDQRDVCQQKVTVQIPGVEPPIIGFADVVRGLTVLELKTTSSRTWWTQERADSSLQTCIYALAISGQNSGAQATVEHHVLKYVDDDCTHEIWTSNPTKADQLEGQDRIRETWENIKKGELNAICKSGKCRFPTRCRDYGYTGQDDRELVVAGR